MQEKVTFPSGGLVLSAVIEFPKDYASEQRRPAIIILHGFGSSKDSANVTTPASMYTQWGYIVFRFDMRGCGQSEGEFGRVICLEQVEDTRSAISYLITRPEIDTSRIAVCGNSAGAAVALYTGGVDSRLAAVISACGWGNGERKLQGQHPTPEGWKKFRDMLERGRQHRAHTGKSLMVARHEIVPIPPHLRGNLPADAVQEFPVETAQSVFDFMPESVLPGISPRPLLLLHASDDSVTPTSESIELFRRAGQPAELHLFHGVDHFILSDGNPRVTECLRGWLAQYFPA